MSAQFADMYLKNAVEHPITGINISRMARLKIYSIAFWRIETFLLFLTLAMPFLDFKSPTITTPRDPSIIVWLATVLSHSDMVVTLEPKRHRRYECKRDWETLMGLVIHHKCNCFRVQQASKPPT